MREIKFRAWNRIDKVMFVPRVINFTFDAGPAVFFPLTGREGGSMALISPIEVDLMIFTGLRDRAGKEIYEGDIVKWGHIVGHYSEESPIRIAEVFLNPDIQFMAWNIRQLFQFGNFAYHKTDECFEIIGNIYEHPELLK